MSKKPSQRRAKGASAAKSVPRQALAAAPQELEQPAQPPAHELEQPEHELLSQGLEQPEHPPVSQEHQPQTHEPVQPEPEPQTPPPPVAAASKSPNLPAGTSGNRYDSNFDNRFDSQSDIRGVLIQLAGARLLLPNATIAEVLSYAPPEPVDAAPEWLLGMMRWRGWQLPLVAFAELAGIGKEPAGLGSKVVVLKALGGHAQAPYFAILSQGFPRLVTVSQQGLLPDADSAELPLGVHSRVRLNEDTAFVPDLDAVELLVTGALAQAA